MNAIKKQKINPILNKYEQDIEDNLDVNKSLSSKEKVCEISKLKAMAKKYLQKI